MPKIVSSVENIIVNACIIIKSVQCFQIIFKIAVRTLMI